MASESLRQEQGLRNRQILQGRLAAAKWISMTEPQVATEVSSLEGDPLFKEMMYGAAGGLPIMRRTKWPASRLHSGFYEIKEGAHFGAGEGDISDLLRSKEDLIKVIQDIGIEAFERYFLHGEDGMPLPEICRTLGIEEAAGRRVLDLVLEVGSRSEFFQPSVSVNASGIRYHCIAAIHRDDPKSQRLSFQFLSTHWSRGRYVVVYDKLEEWKKRRGLEAGEASHLRRLLKRVEMLNMRQDTLFRVLAHTTLEQTPYLCTRQKSLRRSLSLRQLARKIGLATSTVSRAISNRSVRVPWGEEIPIKTLLSGQREVILSVLSEWSEKGRIKPEISDEKIRCRLETETGINVSRRTINECRRKLISSQPGDWQ